MQSVFQYFRILILIVPVPFFFFSGPDYLNARSLHVLWNLGHVLYFFLLTLYMISQKHFSRMQFWSRSIYCVGVTLIIGSAIELLQQYIPGRTPSFSDMANDVSGSMIALLLTGFKGSTSNFVRVTQMSSGLFILLVTFFPPVVVIMDEVRAKLDFPVLAEFENKAELGRWDTGRVSALIVTAPVRSGLNALRVEFTTERYSGLSLVHFPRDWRGYGRLSFSIYNPDGELSLHIRVHDGLHRLRQDYANRFNRKITLEKGWNDLWVDMYDILAGPQKREMDLADISGLGFFVVEESRRSVIYIDNVRLE